MTHIYHIDTRDAYLMIVTFITVLFWGIAEGVGLGVVLSIVLLVWRSSKPHCQVLGRVPGTKVYRSIVAWPNAIITPGILCFRFDGQLFFGNASYLKQATQVVLHRWTHRARKPIYFFILDCQAMNDIDTSGIAAIEAIHKMLKANKVVLLMAGVKYPVMKHLLRSHLIDMVHAHHFFHTSFVNFLVFVFFLFFLFFVCSYSF